MSDIHKLLADHIDIWTSAEIEKKSGRGRTPANLANTYGIRKLRELILELAMRGQLVPQNAEDESANDLLTRIRAHHSQLVSNGLAKKLKPSSIEEAKILYQLPSSWKWVRFGEIAQHNSGKTLDTAKNSGELQYYITTSNVYWGHFELSNLRRMLIQDVEFERYSAKKDDLLICEGGEAGRAAVWNSEKEIFFQNHVHRARFYCGINPYFAFRFFEKLNATNEIIQYRKGVGISSISGKVLSEIKFPLPPIAEQSRIVSKVDEMMELCDQLELKQSNAAEIHHQLVNNLLGSLIQSGNIEDFQRNWKLVATHFDILFNTESSIESLKNALIQLGVMGKLVLHDEEGETANQLIKRIHSAKIKMVADHKIKKIEPLATIPTNEQPFALPPNWEWRRIGDIVESTEYGLSEKTFDSSTGVPVLKMGDIQGGKVVLGGQKKVDENIESLPRLYLQPGDLLYNRTNSAELIGKTGIFEGPENSYTFASYLIRIRCVEGLFSPQYLNLVMNSPLFRKTQIEPHLKQQCGQANVNGSIMKNMIISFPCLSEQQRIVEKVDELTTICDKLKSSINTAMQYQTSLADVLIANAL